MKGEIPPDEFFRRYPAPAVPGPPNPTGQWKLYLLLGLVIFAFATYKLGLLAAILGTPFILASQFVRDYCRYWLFRPKLRRPPPPT
jgi:hypothetical protein